MYGSDEQDARRGNGRSRLAESATNRIPTPTRSRSRPVRTRPWSNRSRSHDPYAVLRNRDYRRFLLAGMVATVGGQMQGVAVGWELYERTGSATALGLVGLAQVVPVILLAIPAGHAADRYNRKHQLIAAHGLLLLASVGLALLSVFRGPGRAGLRLPGADRDRPGGEHARAVVDHAAARGARRVARAVTWNSSCLAGGRDGRARRSGGWSSPRRKGRRRPTVLDAAFSVVVVALIAPIRLQPSASDFQPLSLASLLAGLRFVFRTELILATITLDLFAVLLGGATALAADLRQRHPPRRPDRPGLAPRGAVDGGVRDGARAGPPPAAAAERGRPCSGRSAASARRRSSSASPRTLTCRSRCSS